MSRLFYSRGVLCAVLLAATAGLGAYLLAGTKVAARSREADTTGVPDDPMLIARGEYLAKLGDCTGCHTAKKIAPFAGGRIINSPFGKIYSTNITPDPKTGIGRYTYADFERALREGVAPGGRHLYPAMPYPSFSKITDEDVRALYAYFIHGVPPISNQVKSTALAFPFNQRWGLWLWNAAFAPTARFKPMDERSEQLNRGAYIVQSLGHCGACHTPRGPAFEERGFDEGSPLYLTGGLNDHWFAPNLTGDPGSGLGRLSVLDIASFLKGGHTHDPRGAAFGTMVEVIEDSTQHYTDKDLLAVANYLKSLPAHQASGAYHEPSQTAGRVGRPGAGLYRSFCAKCHHTDGRGEPMKFPALAANPAVLISDPTSLIRLLLEGGRSPETRDGPRPRKMPGFGDHLTDTEIARVLTFIRNAWGNQASAVTTRQASTLRGQLSK